MTPQELHHLITDIENINQSHLSSLTELAKKYPYFQAVHFLISKIDGSSKNIKYAAALTCERNILRKYIYSDFNTEVNMPDLEKLDIEEDLDFLEKFNQRDELSQKKQEISKKEEFLKYQDKENKEIKPKEEIPIMKTRIFQDEKLSPASTDTSEQIRKEILKSIKEIKQKQEYIRQIDNAARSEEKYKSKKKVLQQKYKDIEDTTNEKMDIIQFSSDHFSEKSIKPPVFYPEKFLFSKKKIDKSIIPTHVLVRNLQKKQNHIIKNFLQRKNFTIQVATNTFESTQKKDLSIENINTDIPISENMAEILLKQNKLTLAIKIYKKLISKYPNKKSFFVEKISTLKK